MRSARFHIAAGVLPVWSRQAGRFTPAFIQACGGWGVVERCAAATEQNLCPETFTAAILVRKKPDWRVSYAVEGFGKLGIADGC